MGSPADLVQMRPHPCGQVAFAGHSERAEDGSVTQPSWHQDLGEGAAMTAIDSWPVEISLRAEDGQTLADAQLTRGGGGVIGHGLARRNPDDREVTQIGEEIAAARALSDLAHQLLSDAAGQIESITHERAHLSL